MKIIKRFIWCVALGLLPSANASEPPVSRVVLMGGSSVITSYLPEAAKHKNVLQAALDQHYGAGLAQVHNWADNGEYIARYLITGQYDRLRNDVGGVDLFIIRFGTNDAKRMPPKEFGEHLEKLIDLLREDYPDAKVILEDGLYLDYPAHYDHDRNKKQKPYWDQTREIARKRGLPLSALFEASEKATREGNWDLRIRRQEKNVITLDASKDSEHPGDVKWFTDIHPNPAGVRIAVESEMTAIKALYTGALPSGGRKLERKRTPSDYIALLNFAPERLAKKAISNPDRFQKPVQ